MTKKNSLATCAERMFVIEQMTINEIASQLQVHEKTIRNWKEEYNWASKRQQYVNTTTMFHEELFNFARKLMTSIEYDIDNNEKVDSGRMFAFTKMLPLITKIKAYEDEVAKKDTDNKSTELSPDFIRQINEEFLGIKSYDE